MPEDSEQEFGGNYRLLDKIATGGMAEVWRARATGMAGFEKILVIKKVLPHLARDSEFVRLFIDEARIAVQLMHVNIVQVFDLGEYEGSYFMAMEYVSGMDLARLIGRSKANGPMPIALVLFICAEVLKALSFAHERTDERGVPLRIVHCDISPQNILISFAGEVKITDFGISKAAFQSSDSDTIRGKYAYMSPEQIEGMALDGRSDLFSLGIVLYELLTNRRLFKAKNRDETLARVKRAEVPSPRGIRPEISEDLEAFMLRALARRRGDRFPNAQTMLDDLGALMVREGHRATNNDLSSFVTRVIERGDRRAAGPASAQPMPRSVVVLAAEATPPPRSLATPRTTLATLTQEWSGLIAEAGGEIWERDEGAMLAVWTTPDELKSVLQRAVQTSVRLRRSSQKAGYRLSAGVAPGVARMHPDRNRPPEGWELAGPFYLARWMMNLSAHRGRVLLTEVGAKQVGDQSCTPLGRISIQGNRYINLYEVS